MASTRSFDHRAQRIGSVETAPAGDRKARMMSRFLLFSALLANAGCRQNDAPEDAAALLAEVQDDDYTKWGRAPGYDDRRPTSAPHGDAVEIFINDVVREALASGPGAEAYPDGAVIVKDQFNEDGSVQGFSIMKKVDGAWFWAEYDEEGEPLYSGAPSICTDCHGSGDDFVRAFSRN
jgi:hypothetical protein